VAPLDVALPHIAPLNASKFAFRAINDALRKELASIDRTITALRPEQRTLYA
jgi:NADP-dependent 3-hydroxy acid dehydrogenase YdfG